MKKISILMTIVCLIAVMTGCAQKKSPVDYGSDINGLNGEMDSMLTAEQEMDEDLAELETENFSETENLDDEVDGLIDDETQIEEEMEELESMEL